MTNDLNPQAREMADESMVRNLAAQARAIWPQERPLLDRYRLPDGARILDAGCGSGEITARLAERFPGASLVGVDVLAGPLELARARAARFGDRVRFEQQSVYALPYPEGGFDLTVCRHVLQAIPEAARAIAELARVTRPGGWLHLITEDFGMMHFPRRRLDPDEFWREGALRYGALTGTDMHIGRHAPAILRRLGLEEIRADLVVVDPLRVPREDFAAIWTAWRDGYAEAVAHHTGMSLERVVAHFDDMIETIRDPDDHCAWHVPVVSGRLPARTLDTSPR